jgi:single-strand DNA-binding protein
VSSFNRIILVGNLTRDPQLSYTPANTAVCKFGIATNHKWKDRDGNAREEVCFVDCTSFGKAGETFNQYMTKGRSVLVEGRLKLDQWTTPEGDKRSKHEVIVDNFTFLGGGRGGDVGGRGGETNAAAVPATAGVGGGSYEAPPQTGDDIPF